MPRKTKQKRKLKEKGNYEKCWDYLKESWIYFTTIFFLFLISTSIGILFPIFLKETISKILGEIVKETSDMNFFELLIFIWKNNISTAFFGMILGVILGIFPVLIALFNGYVLGFVAKESIGIGGYLVLIRLLPHGIFEIPALVISLGLGLKLTRFVFSSEPKKQLKYDLENSLRVFLYVVIPLLLIAGIIETILIFI